MTPILPMMQADGLSLARAAGSPPPSGYLVGALSTIWLNLNASRNPRGAAGHVCPPSRWASSRFAVWLVLRTLAGVAAPGCWCSCPRGR
jgi:hypothetical protein